MDEVDQAIVRYHEVRHLVGGSRNHFLTFAKALSIDPLNSHTLDLLHLALEAITDVLPFRGKVPGGEEMWQKMMKEQAAAAAKKAVADEKDKAGTSKPAESTSTGEIQDVAMADACPA